MSAVSSIEWTDRTWNPVRGCTRVSEGCRHCYAETFAARNLPGMRSPTTGKPFAVQTSAGPRWTGKVELIPALLDAPLRWRKPQRVFVNSMSDLFHESLSFEDIARVIDPMAWGFRLVCRKGDACECDCQHDTDCLDLTSPCRCWKEVPQHTYQVLTKRPQRMLDFFRWLDAPAPNTERSNGLHHAPTLTWCREEADWPLENLWLGVSVEDQVTADERIPLLLQTPAAVRFVSYEPALGPVDFDDVRDWFTTNKSAHPGRPSLDWIIVGGESGPGARPFDVEWARSTVSQCQAAGIPVFVKQMGGNVRTRNDSLATDCPPACPDEWPEPEEGWDDAAGGNLERDLDGTRDDYQGAPVRIRLKNRKGGDPAEWPEDLRVREFPKATA